jgi:hypothetical protein
MYNELAWRSWIHALRGEALKLYTRTMPELDSEAAQSEKQSSHDKSRGQRGIFSVECVCVCAKREEGWRDMCHYYTSKSLDWVEPSRSPALATGIVARYDEQAERSWIHASRGGASRLYTRSTPQKPRNQTDIGHRQKLERDKRREIRRGTERCQRGRFMISI